MLYGYGGASVILVLPSLTGSAPPRHSTRRAGSAAGRLRRRPLVGIFTHECSGIRRTRCTCTRSDALEEDGMASETVRPVPLVTHRTAFYWSSGADGTLRF